jgi:hypothetical protein
VKVYQGKDSSPLVKIYVDDESLRHYKTESVTLEAGERIVGVNV